MRSTAKAAVDPVPSPTTISDFTYSTAFHAACFFSSSWDRAAILIDERGATTLLDLNAEIPREVRLACMERFARRSIGSGMDQVWMGNSHLPNWHIFSSCSGVLNPENTLEFI